MQSSSMETAAAVPTPPLPDDMLAAIFGRLPASSLAASRCVCQAWRSLVDGRRLLLRHLLPHSVRGIFANYIDHAGSHFFARPRPASTDTAGRFNHVVHEWPYIKYQVVDHCNGLVLYRDEDNGELCVCNPVTRQAARLPSLAVCGSSGMSSKPRVFLVFDPAVSVHYDVLVAPLHPEKQWAAAVHTPPPPPTEDMEWPPSRWTWHVFSSRTRQWRERVFVREGEAVGLVAEMLMDSVSDIMEAPWRYAAYWQGALYVHCHGEYVSRMSLSDCKYQVITSPIEHSEWYNKVQSWYDKVRPYLGRSKEGIYFATIRKCRLSVWTLKGWHDGAEWILKHDHVLRPHDWWGVVLASGCQQLRRDGPWILDDFGDGTKAKSTVDWSSDDDDVISTCEPKENKKDGDMYPGHFRFLGFHPYKEVMFLSTRDAAVAYHLDTSKVQFLGILKPSAHSQGVYDSFVYTPCHSRMISTS